MNKAQVLFTCSEEFKEALGEYAIKNNVSVAHVIREAVAVKIEYDLSKEKIVDGRRKYESAEARKEAQRKKQKTDRQNVAALLAAYAKEQRRIDAMILEQSLKKKGIEVD